MSIFNISDLAIHNLVNEERNFNKYILDKIIMRHCS